jgi:predicted dehydrogenase/nucleoside-diphosphate-sugar epimerase
VSAKKTVNAKVYRVGVIGAGNISSCHILALRSLDRVEIIGITDLDQVRGKHVATTWQIPFFPSAQEMYRAKPDVVHILTPPSSHCAVALEALANGCHVFVEKPMATSQEECDLLIQQAEAVKRTLSVDHSAKFDPTVQKALHLVSSGAIGAILSVDYFRSSEYPPYSGGPMPPHYQDGGFPFRDIGVHALYLAETFLGEIKNIETTHRGTGCHTQLMFDEWSGVVHCDNGTARFQLSWTSRPIQHILSIHGASGNIVLDLYLGTCVINKSLPVPKPVEAIVNSIVTAFHTICQLFWNISCVAMGKFVRGADIHSSVREFYSALSTGASPPVSVLEGKRMVQWLEKYALEADIDKRQRVSPCFKPKPASILVTGGTGFLGRALVSVLASSGERVRLLVRRMPPEEIKNHPLVEIVLGDLGDPDVVDRAVQGVEIVYHIGAATSGSWSDHECGTIWGTKNVVNSCLRHRVMKLVYVSSLSVLEYASLPGHARLTESSRLETFPEKRGHYAKAKLQAEEIVREAIQKRGLKAVILRPGSVFGPGAEKVSPYGIVSFGNRWLVMGNGKTLLPLVYVDDVIEAFLKAAASDKAIGQILHLVDPDQIIQQRYLEYALDKMPEIRVAYVPMAILNCAAAAMQALVAVIHRGAPLTPYRLRSIKPGIEFDCSAAHNTLDWVPSIGTQRGLEITFGQLQVPLKTRWSFQRATRRSVDKLRL